MIYGFRVKKFMFVLLIKTRDGCGIKTDKEM